MTADDHNYPGVLHLDRRASYVLEQAKELVKKGHAQTIRHGLMMIPMTKPEQDRALELAELSVREEDP